MAVAESSYLTAAATLDDFFRTLRGTAASAFIDAVADRMIVAQKRNSYAALDKLANTNEKRFQAGDIDEVDANQAQVDALQALDDLHSSIFFVLFAAFNSPLRVIIILLNIPLAVVERRRPQLGRVANLRFGTCRLRRALWHLDSVWRDHAGTSPGARIGGSSY